MLKEQNQNSTDKIKCPKCGERFQMTQALQHQVAEKIKQEVEQEFAQKEKEAVKREKAVKEALALKEKEILEREQNLKKERLDLEQQIQKRVLKEKAKLEKEAEDKAQQKLKIQMEDLKEQVKEKTTELNEAQKKELNLIKRERELEEARKTQELEIQRKIRGERKTIEDNVSKRIAEEYRAKDLEKDKQINDSRKQVIELKRKLEQGSQQAQGEVMEIVLEDLLKENFHSDTIKQIAKGVPGGDVLQKVFSQSGKQCGSILWESKQTKTWKEIWIAKLKKDQREAQADIAVIVSECLPKDIKGFDQRNGVWVTNRFSVLGLATALRKGLLEVAAIKRASIGKDEKTEILWKYVVSPQFRQRVEAIVEAFGALHADLEKEKRAFNRIWAKREQHLRQVSMNTVGLYGDMQGLIGPSMQSIPALEAGEPEEPEEEKVADNKKDS